MAAALLRAVAPPCTLSAGEPPKDAPPHVHVSSKREMEILRGPKPGDDRARWLQEQRRWREEFKRSIGFETTEYDRPELAWRLRDFVQTMLMVEDRYFYDPVAGRYTVDRFLDDLEARYGGVDSAILWAIYPNIGVDNRNQFDLLRDLPGGPAALRGVIADFHRRGVRVFLPIMPWDIGTRDEGRSLAEAVVVLAREIGADGVFGDTVRGFTRDDVQTARSLGCPLVFEHESTMVEEDRLSWGTMSWGYWLYGPEPVLSKYKWVDPRHKVHVCERWAKDRTDQLQSAFFNGVGYETWENIWGIWNPLNARDAAALRRMAAIERAMTDLLISAEWEPFVATGAAGVHASKFPGAGQALWLLVNRTAGDVQAALPIAPPAPLSRYFDLWHGREISPRVAERGVVLSFPIEAWGFGAILAVDPAKVPPGIDALLKALARLAGPPLGPRRGEASPLRQTIVPIARTAPASAAPEGMVPIPAGRFRFRVSGVEIEGGDKPGVDVQYPWEDAPCRHHDKVISIDAFHIDRHPVTNAQFRRFLDHSGYRPRDIHNFLRDWIDGAPPAGWEKKPVTWVSLEDARAYAAWAGKRLPHEWEWQYAAQGTDERDHPWGSGANPLAVPAICHTRGLPPPADVDAHPQGASPFGVEDMTANIWQWTDEFTDEHTRAAIIRGGCAYRPDGSKWYFPGNGTLREHGKYLLMAPSRDRAGTIGFRCVVDAAVTARADAPASGELPVPAGRTASGAEKAHWPNVIIVLTDDQGYGDLSCHGNPVLKTPNLDRLHAESIRLTDFHVTPMCTPSRGQLLTGIDALRNGATNVANGRALLRQRYPTIADLLAAAGYRCGQFGKWHLGENHPCRPHERGFHEAIAFPSSHIGSAPDFWGNDYQDDVYVHNGRRERYSGYTTDVLFREAMRWMRQQAAVGQPFLCYLPTAAPHAPLNVPQKYWQPYQEQPPDIARFFGMISNLDENMGRLDAFLRETGLRENTILHFLTDNGSYNGVPVYNAGMRGRKVDLYEGGHRVPCFVRWPAGRLRPPGEVDALTQVQDLVPTLLDLCGVRPPADARFDGTSLAPLLRGDTDSLPDRTLVVQFSHWREPALRKGDAAVLWRRWRLVHDRELYDLRADPGQMNNLIAQHEDVVARLRAHYGKWWEGVSPHLNDFEPVVIGSDAENPAQLAPTEWADVFVDKSREVRNGIRKNGAWHLVVERAGRYEVELRRWPREADLAIAAAAPPLRHAFGELPAGVALPIARARLQIGDIDETKPVAAADTAATFMVGLPRGRTQLKTTFSAADGAEICGAYYVYVARR